ncbi:uracil-DNA glycosylase family protein [Flaviaesturariibacter amylovorans]|uniref:Uracil-DNA glycosylase-like domain-containing protein n=1 Tax=Flaviaesturariibacter amylovorans TaxID=1084520 RepID=A0ABP8HP24_9BACT
MSEVSYIEFANLCKEVKECLRCPRMANSLRVLNSSSGSITSRVLFIGEAPGRLGADGSGIPFHGDKSGHNFEALLSGAGLSRSIIFVTNAVLCNPKDEKGNNSTPTKLETANCATFLKKQIELVDPTVIVTLGASALKALANIVEHNFTLKDSVRNALSWNSRILVPLYHPGQRAMMSRPFEIQQEDYRFVVECLKENLQGFLPTSNEEHVDLMLLVDYVLSKVSTVTYQVLHKLIYLVDYKAISKIGRRLTSSHIVKQKEGPYCTDLHLYKIHRSLPYIKSRVLSKNNIVLYAPSNSLFEDRLIDQFEISDDAKGIVDDVLSTYSQKSNTALRRTTLYTRPMRKVIYRELNENIDLNNSVLF